MIKSIWVEIRPALNCSHFCLVLSSSETKKNIQCELGIKKSGLVIDLNGKRYNVNFKEFTVEPLTMSSFKWANECVSFRIQTECNFKFEKHLSLKSFFPVFGHEKFSILCKCHNPLTIKLAFERVLPLPSNNFSFSEIFCHPTIDMQQLNTAPRSNDCFYSDDFIEINQENVIGCSEKNKFLKCKRCLCAVGTSTKNSVKFWISCLKLPFDVFPPSEYLKRLIKKAVSDPLAMFPKILLECLETETYLSMMIVDKNLLISTCQEDLILKSMQVVKLKYKFHSFSDSDIKLLKEDPFHSLYHIQVHKSMLDYSTKFLISCSKAVPSIFSKVNNECMAYFILN